MKNFTLIAFMALLFTAQNLSAQYAIYTEGYGSGITFAEFGGSTNSITEDATTAHTGTKSLKIAVPAAGYTGGALKAAAPVNLSTYNAVSFWVKASAAKTLNVAGLGNNATTTVYSSEYNNISVTTTWTKVVIPIPNPAKFTAEDGLFHFAEGGDEGAYSLWFDDIQYETTTVATPTAAMATETISKFVGDSFSPNGTVCTFGGITFNISKAYFNYTSSNTGAATMSALGVGSAVGAGSSNITAMLGAVAVSGTLTVNVSAAASGPTVAAPTPPSRTASDVISLFSDAYTQTSTTIDWNPNWGQSTVVTDVMVAGNATKKYANLNYQGVAFTPALNVSSMTHLHIDVWTPNCTAFEVYLINPGPVEQPVVLTPTLSGWNSFDIPLSSYTTIALNNVFQFKFVGTPFGSSTVYFDNVYFYKTSAVTMPTVAAPTPPARAAADVISMFSNAYTNLAGTNWNPSWGQSTVYTEVQIAGNDTKKYTNLNYQGAEPAATINATAMTNLHVDVWTATTSNFRVKLVDFGANGTYQGGDDTEHELSFDPTGGSWVSLDIPLANFTGMTARAHVAQFIISSTSTGPTFWVDNIYFWKNPTIPVELTFLKAKNANNTTILNWQTASERDNQGFTIERSTNGTTYNAIGQVKGNGSTNTAHDYTFTDNTPSVNTNYYRLRQTDFNGKETLSPVVSVIFGKNGLVVKSNLVHNTLDVTVGEESPSAIGIYNLSGQQVYTGKVQGTQRIDVSGLAAGLYIIRTQAGEVSRFVKE